MLNQKPINVVGIGPKGEVFYKNLIENADILIGGKRLLNFFKHIQCEKIPITNNLSELISFLYFCYYKLTYQK